MTEMGAMAPEFMGAVADRVDAAWRSLIAARDALDKAMSGAFIEMKPNDRDELLKGVRRSLETAILEERRIEDARRIERGGDGLDLDAARAEIGRRLDRILAAGDA